jgi:hypothetical protein
VKDDARRESLAAPDAADTVLQIDAIRSARSLHGLAQQRMEVIRAQKQQ